MLLDKSQAAKVIDMPVGDDDSFDIAQRVGFAEVLSQLPEPGKQVIVAASHAGAGIDQREGASAFQHEGVARKVIGEKHHRQPVDVDAAAAATMLYGRQTLHAVAFFTRLA